MGGNRQKKSSSSFSIFGLFKSRRSHRRGGDDQTFVDDTRKVWPSDEDKRNWVAEPGIDRKASAFIAKFHATRVSESELQFAPNYPPHQNP
ncbi:uncharacterized protein LOC110815469 [Carica papaya]|uniref:uncharacterized protein LOC110815469 n=1 Tax=Carica papaya TaxID=3649 RepID=UPI000B8CE07F|nr:uncharacterized protein LOC110815469 [Carica papaya]